MREMADLIQLLKGEDARDISAVAEVLAERQIIEFLKSKGGEYEFEGEFMPYIALDIDGVEYCSVHKLSLDENDNIIVFVNDKYEKQTYTCSIYDFLYGQIIVLLDFLC